jgi:hypothetical protein
VGAGSYTPVVDAAIDDHLHGRIFTEDLKQRPTRVLAGSRDHNQKGTFAVFHTAFSFW